MNRLLNYGVIVVAAMLIASFAFAQHSQATSSDSDATEPLPAVKPESVGVSSERLEQIGVVLRGEIARKTLPGAVVAIARNGKLVYYEAFGTLGDAAGSPMSRNAIFLIGSMTKVLTAVGVLQLAERGQLSLSAPIGDYLPQLKDRVVVAANGTEPARRQPTLQDLLRHTAGMTYGFEASRLRTNVWDADLAKRYGELAGIGAAVTLSASDFLAKLGALPLQYQPSTRWEYSLGPDVAGIAIEAVTKQRLGQYLQAQVFEPLGMADTSFTLPAGKLGRFAPAASNVPLGDQSIPRGHDCGDACAYSTAADYLRFAEMLRRGGSLDGVRVLGRKTVEFMTMDQLGPEVNVDDLWTTWPYLEGYGFGLTVAVRRSAGGGGMPGSPGDFNWGGGGGTYFWVDPKEELSAVLMASAPAAARLRPIVVQLVYASLE